MEQIGALDHFLLGAEKNNVSDLLVTFWPNVQFIQHNLRLEGRLPLWRTLIFSGAPFDVDPQSGLWYLPNLVFLFFPAAAGFNLLFWLHTCIAGLGLFTWARSCNISASGSFLAACAYAFAPKSFAHLGTGHAGLFYAAAYVPWVLWSARGLGRGNWRLIGALGISLGAQLIAHPQLAFYTGLTAGGYGLLNAARQGRTFSWRSAGGLVLGVLLAFALAAVQILPLMRFAALSSRSSLDFAGSSVSSLPWRYLWGLIIADHAGFMDYVVYCGLPVLVLALIGSGRRAARGYWGFILIALIYALGINTPLYSLAFRLLPILTWLRAPTRIWFLASAALALLAGIGYDLISTAWSDSARRAARLAAVAVGALASGLLIGYYLMIGRPPANLIAFGLIMPAVAVLMVCSLDRCLAAPISLFAWAVLLLVDLWLMDSSLISGRPAQQVLAENGLAAYLVRQPVFEPFRIYSPSYSLPRHIAAQYQLETVDGVDPLYLDDYDRYMQLATGIKRRNYGVTIPEMEGDGPLELVNQRAVMRLDLLGQLNVRYVAAEFPVQQAGLRLLARFGSTYLYENAAGLPRAWIVGQVASVPDHRAAFQWIEHSFASDRAVVERGPTLATGVVQSKITWLSQAAGDLTLQVALDRPGLLVFSQTWYPGWQAKVDGVTTDVWRVNAILSGVFLAPGTHQLEMAYLPDTLQPGLFISFLASLICGSILIKRGNLGV